MRINGFLQLKEFYKIVLTNRHPIKPQHISLYIFYLNQNNSCGWIEWFQCPFEFAMAGASLTNRRTYYKCLEDLQVWKLIEYQKGSNQWTAPLIKVVVLKRTCTATSTAIRTATSTATRTATRTATSTAIHNKTLNYKPITGNSELGENAPEEIPINESKQKFEIEAVAYLASKHLYTPSASQIAPLRSLERRIRKSIESREGQQWREVSTEAVIDFFKEMIESLDDWQRKNRFQPDLWARDFDAIVNGMRPTPSALPYSIDYSNCKNDWLT